MYKFNVPLLFSDHIIFQQQNRLYPSNSKTKMINIPSTSLGRKIMIAIPTAIQNKIKPMSRFMLSPEKEHILLLIYAPFLIS